MELWQQTRCKLYKKIFKDIIKLLWFHREWSGAQSKELGDAANPVRIIYLPVFVHQSQPASALGSTLLRCDKLDQAEIKSLLMCFLHVLKSMSEGNVSLSLCLRIHTHLPSVCNTELGDMSTGQKQRFSLPDALFTYWNKASSAELMDFFTLIE